MGNGWLALLLTIIFSIPVLEEISTPLKLDLMQLVLVWDVALENILVDLFVALLVASVVPKIQTRTPPRTFVNALPFVLNT